MTRLSMNSPGRAADRDRPRRRQLAEVELQNTESFPEIDADGLRSWLVELLRSISPRSRSFGVRFVDDEEMSEINNRFRSRQGPTDVLSFAGDTHSEDHHLGDVVIAVPMAGREAKDTGIPVDRELRYLLLHGLLHCLGHDHETDDGEMEELELALRRRWISHVD